MIVKFEVGWEGGAALLLVYWNAILKHRYLRGDACLVSGD